MGRCAKSCQKLRRNLRKWNFATMSLKRCVKRRSLRCQSMFVRTRIQTMSLAESRLSSEEGVGRGERERRTEEPRQGRGGREAGKEKEENVASETETEKRGQRSIKLDKIENKQPH